MPSPVFCGKGATAGHTGPAPTHPMRWTSVGRRALTPPQRTDSVVHPCGWIWGRCNRADVGIGPYEGFPLKKAPSAPKMGRSVLLDFDFYFLALLSTTWRSRATNASRDMAPRSPSVRCRGETVPFSMSRSPTTTM